MGPEINVVHIPLECGHAELDCRNAILRFVSSFGEAYYDFKLSSSIEYLDRESQDCPVCLVGDGGGRHFVFSGADSNTDKEIHVEIRDGAIDYWLVGSPRQAVQTGGHAATINCVHYGQDGPGQANASAHRFEEFFNVSPDRYGSCIPKAAKMCFKLGVQSFRFEKDNNFPHDCGRTIIPPYVAALRIGDEWLGVGTLEIPSSEYGLNMTFQDGKAVTDFFYGGNLTLSGRYAFPRITFRPSRDKLVAMRQYIDRLFAEGLAVRNEQWEEAWAGPFYCFFSDQMYEYQVDRDTEGFHGEMMMTERYCNDAFLRRCLDFLAEGAIYYRNIIIDYGWFVMNGQWRPNTRRFKDFKATIRRLQEMGKKVLVWYSPYYNAEKSANYQSHPEIGVKNRDGKPIFVTRFGIEVNFQSDFTHPAMRELCRADLRFMLSEEGLNADGIKIDCTQTPPTIENVFHDTSWGMGEMFHYRTAKFLYDEAKKIKPTCCVNATAGNPLFNRTYDVHRIHDAMEYNIDAYEERAWSAWVSGAGVSDLDDWPSYDLFLVRANLRKIVYGAPSLYAAMRRGGTRKNKASWGYSVSPNEGELRLLSSIYDLYRRVPVDPRRHDIFIDPFRKVFHRRFSAAFAVHQPGKPPLPVPAPSMYSEKDGPLAGFFAATTLCGNQAVAVYDERAAHVVSISDVALAVPLPPGAGEVKLAAMDRAGGESPVGDFEIIDGDLLFQARRCDGDVQCYRITYLLGPRT